MPKGDSDLTLLEVDPTSGRFDSSPLESGSWPADFLFASLMLANGETGVVQPVAEIASNSGPITRLRPNRLNSRVAKR